VKTCIKCGEVKNESEFYLRKDSNTLRLDCKDCRRAIGIEYYKSNSDKIKSRVYEWRKGNPETVKQYCKDWGIKNKERKRFLWKRWAENNPNDLKTQRKKWAKKYYKNNPEMLKLRKKVWYCRKTGKIKPGECSICGTINDIQGHHEDYLKPLDIIWLCRKHHQELHNKSRAKCLK
jgi:hypothetical protein